MQSGPDAPREEDTRPKIFLSYPEPNPRHPAQREFVSTIEEWLDSQGLCPARLGSNNFSLEPPLEAVRQLMPQCSGLLCIAFRRTKVHHATMLVRHETGEYADRERKDVWLTSPWCHIESAMGYQLGLPMMILRETQIIKEGVLDWGNVGKFIVTFDLTSGPKSAYLETNEWKALSAQWIEQVEGVYTDASMWSRLRQIIGKDGSTTTTVRIFMIQVFLGLLMLILLVLRGSERCLIW